METPRKDDGQPKKPGPFVTRFRTGTRIDENGNPQSFADHVPNSPEEEKKRLELFRYIAWENRKRDVQKAMGAGNPDQNFHKSPRTPERPDRSQEEIVQIEKLRTIISEPKISKKMESQPSRSTLEKVGEFEMQRRRAIAKFEDAKGDFLKLALPVGIPSFALLGGLFTKSAWALKLMGAIVSGVGLNAALVLTVAAMVAVLPVLFMAYNFGDAWSNKSKFEDVS